MPWNEQAFREKILEAGARRGLSERDIMRKAGVSEDTFNKSPGPYGRTFNMIEGIASAVGLSVAEAIGQQSALSIVLLEQAVGAALRAIPSDQPELLPDAIVLAYDVLSERTQKGLPIDESALSTLESMLRRGRPR
jgi:hypothetical protein